MEAGEAHYRDLVEKANSIILRMNTRGIVTFVNEFAERFFLYTKEELLGRSVVGTIVPDTDSTESVGPTKSRRALSRISLGTLIIPRFASLSLFPYP